MIIQIILLTNYLKLNNKKIIELIVIFRHIAVKNTLQCF